MTDPTPAATPTRDEAVRELIGGLLRDGCTYADRKAAADYLRAMLASAPAPASGGVDAVAKLLQEIYRVTDKESERAEHAVRQRPSIRPVTNARRMHCADRVNCLAQEALSALASLSPAATPVSEAGGGVTEAMIDAGCAAWVELYPAFEGEKPQPTAGDVVKAILIAALAKPAGGDVDWKSLFETAHGALICVAEAQADAHYARKVADELTDAALSQSTSAGRVGE